MNTTNVILLTGAVVIAGKAAQGKRPTSKQIVGSVVLLIILTSIDNWNSEVGRQFGSLILFAALLMYLPTITKRLGYTK